MEDRLRKLETIAERTTTLLELYSKDQEQYNTKIEKILEHVQKINTVDVRLVEVEKKYNDLHIHIDNLLILISEKENLMQREIVNNKENLDKLSLSRFFRSIAIFFLVGGSVVTITYTYINKSDKEIHTKIKDKFSYIKTKLDKTEEHDKQSHYIKKELERLKYEIEKCVRK